MKNLPEVEETIKLLKADCFPDYIQKMNKRQYSLRFELGGSESKTFISRTNQAIHRAHKLYDELFGDKFIFIVLKEWPIYPSGKVIGLNKNIFKIIAESNFKRFKGPFTQAYYERDHKDEIVKRIFKEPQNFDLLYCKTKLTEAQIKAIIAGLASVGIPEDMVIHQDVAFYLGENETGFRIYDDRGCDVWSNNRRVLYPLYRKYKNWILDYNREQMDKIFVNWEQD